MSVVSDYFNRRRKELWKAAGDNPHRKYLVRQAAHGNRPQGEVKVRPPFFQYPKIGRSHGPLSNNKYQKPHQGKQECARRVRQMS